MDFKDFLRVLRRRWKTIIAVFALAIIASAGYSLLATPKYQSTASVAISTDVTSSTDAYIASFFASSRVNTYAQLATSGAVLQKVIDEAHLDLTPSELAPKISAVVPTGTTIITVSARDDSAREAQVLAQTVAEQLSSYIADFETPNGKEFQPVKAVVSDPADFDGSPVSPKTTLYLIIAAFLGLILGLALALVRDILDSTIKSPEDVGTVVDQPVLGHVSYDANLSKHPLLTDLGSHDPRTEAFRLVRTNLQYLSPDSTPKSFVITSALPGEGKTSTSTNLAIALAQAGKRVLLVDADLRQPNAARVLGLERSVGLTTVLVGRSTLQESVQHHAASGIDFLASGPLPPNPTEILQSRATRDLMTTLSAQYDAVVVDAPPLLPVADAAIVATYVDGAMVVIRHGRTTKDQLKHAVDRLNHVGATVFGVLSNMSPRRGSRNYGEGYAYGYGYGYGYGYSDAFRPDNKGTGRS